VIIFKQTFTIHLRFLFPIILLLLLVPGSQAQFLDEKDFVVYTSKDGLSDNRVNSIVQDGCGYIWIATRKGLNRFDGNSFLRFYSDTSYNSLPNDFIKKLKWIDEQQLGASTATGLHIIQPTTLQQRNIIIPPGPMDQPYVENNIHGMAGDEKGNLFLLGSTGFYHFNKKDELVFRYDHYNKEDAGKSDVPFGRSDGVIMPEPGLLLLATTAGPFSYRISTRKLERIDENNGSLYSQIGQGKGWVHFMHCNEGSFSVIAEGATEMAWFDNRKKKKYLLKTSLTGLDKLFGWRSKITRLNDSTYTITANQKGFYLLRYHRNEDSYVIHPELYLPGYLCASIFKDKQNRLWIGTDRGLFKQQKNAGHLVKLSLPANKTKQAGLSGISCFEASGNKLFIGTFGAGIYVYNRKSLQFLHHIDLSKVRPSGTANNVYSLLAWKNDSIYAGTFGPLTAISTGNYGFRTIRLPDWDNDHNWISWLLKSSDTTMYIATNKNNIFFYRKKNDKGISLSGHNHETLFNIRSPMYIKEDRQGNIWFGGHGVSRFNKSNHRFDLLIDSFPRIRIARKEINSLAFDEQGKIYFAISETGLSIYDTATKNFKHITRSDGLPDNTIRAMQLCNNKVWLGTESGLASYDILKQKVSSFGMADGLPEGPFTAYHFFYDSVYGKLYGGILDQIIQFNPDSLEKNDLPPGFFIESIQVNGNSMVYHPSGQFEIPYDQNSLVLSLAAVNFEDAHRQQFAYRILQTGNEAWLETGSQRSIIFNNLPPGKYRLQVKVYIKNNSWPEQVQEILIIIKPPFWQHAWFILLCVVLLIAALWLGLRTRIRHVRQKAAVNAQLAELEMKGLHAQMNPHFIFNCLNSIKEMILLNEKQSASRYLSKFAHLIRTNLEHSTRTFITIKESIDQLQQYLDLEKIRLHQFDYQIQIEDELDTDNIQMAPMLLQPLVENAIWHGLHPKHGEKKLTIRFFTSGHNLICEVEDNGIGIVQSRRNKMELRPNHQSFGISNVRERLNILNEKYKMNCALSIIDMGKITSEKEKGTLVKLELTIIHHQVR
jgi:signal transduction histidine kinase